MTSQNNNSKPQSKPDSTKEIPIKIDETPYKAPKEVMTGAELRQLAKPPIGPDRDLRLVDPGPQDDIDIDIDDTDAVTLKPGMHFKSRPRAHVPEQIIIKIDHKPYPAPKPVMTGAELRQLAKPPIGQERDLFRVVPGQGDDIKLADTDAVTLEKGMQFYSAPGRINPGQACRLPESDEDYLKQKGVNWEVQPSGGGAYLILKGIPVSAARYNQTHVDMLLQLPQGYPMAGLDMYWVSPDLRLKTGGYPEAASHFEHIAGRQWQRFSRHLAEPWKPGQDSLPSFLALALGELQGRL